MDEQEQQNQQDSFLKQQGNKAKDKLKDKMKDDAKKAIMKKVLAIIGTKAAIIFGIVLASTIGVIVLLAGFNKIIKGSGESKTNNAKAQAVTTTYSTNASTTGTDEDGNIVSKVAITTNASKTGYEIIYNNDSEYLEDVREELEGNTVESAEEFTDFELGLLGALMDNGADLDYYSEQELQCFDEFIKAESCTQNLDLRPNSEKESGKKTGDYIENYEPQKIDNLAENEVPGVILVQRTNTNSSTTPITLEYKEKEGENGFDKLIEEGNQDVLNYFTIDEKGNLIIAKWSKEDVKIDTTNGDYNKLSDEIKTELESQDKVGDKKYTTTYTLTPEPIAYTQYISKYKMPFEFLTQLLVITEEPDFCMELVNYVLNSKIVINIQEEETITVTKETRDYTVHSKEEKSINYEVNAIGNQIEKENNYIFKNAKDDEQDENGENNCTNYSSEDLTVEVITKNTSHSYVFEIIEADTWIAHYKKTYADTETEGPTTTPSDPTPDENAEYKQIESEDKYPITDEKTINKDKDVKAFIDEKVENYEAKIKVPSVSLSNETDEDGNKYKVINVTGGTKIGETNFSEIKDKTGKGTGEYSLPLTIVVKTQKVASTDKTKEIPQINYGFARTTRSLLGKTIYGYEILTDIDPLVECKVSSLDVKQFEKIVLDNYIETTVTKHISNPNLPTTDIYAKDENENFEKFLLAYDNSKGAQNQINSIDSWLFEMMEENEATVELVDVVKYLLYLYDDVDRGVTELDLEMFKPAEFRLSLNASSMLAEVLKSFENETLRKYMNGESNNYASVEKYVNADRTKYKLYYTDFDGCLNFSYGIMVYDGNKLNNKQYFEDEGINLQDLINQYNNGQDVYVDVEIIDRIYLKIINARRSSLKAALEKNGANLKSYQIDALTNVSYQYGNCGQFIDGENNIANLYNKYYVKGETEEFKQKAVCQTRSGGLANFFVTGNYATREKYNWIMFNEGKYFLSNGTEIKGTSGVVEFALQFVGENHSRFTSYSPSNEVRDVWFEDDWCAMFVSYCYNECGLIPDVLDAPFCLCSAEVEHLESKNQMITDKGYIPEPGDIIFFTNGTRIYHTGIVVDCDGTKVYTVEGNSGSSNTTPYWKGSKVTEVEYLLTSSKIYRIF